MRTNYNLTLVLIACLVIIALMSLFISFYQYNDDIVVTDRQPAEKQPMFMMLTFGKHDDDGWNEAHANGFLVAVSQLNLVAEIHDSIGPQECRLYIDDFVVRGGNVVIAPSRVYEDCINLAAAHYPQVKFITTISEGVKDQPNVYSFFSRMYYVRYLSGILAGMTSKGSQFGYVYLNKNSEVIRGINAFTLGVKKVNPHAKVFTFQLPNNGKADLPRRLDEFYDRYPHIKTWTYHLSGNDVERFCDRNFLQCVSYHVNKQSSFVNSSIGSAVWDWSMFYRQLARRIIVNEFTSGSDWLPVRTATAKLKGVGVDVPVEVVNYIDSEMSCLLSHECEVFRGIIRDNQGNIRVSSGTVIPDNELLFHFNWFVDGVEEVDVQ